MPGRRQPPPDVCLKLVLDEIRQGPASRYDVFQTTRLRYRDIISAIDRLAAEKRIEPWNEADAPEQIIYCVPEHKQRAA